MYGNFASEAVDFTGHGDAFESEFDVPSEGSFGTSDDLGPVSYEHNPGFA